MSISLRGILKLRSSPYGYVPTKWICILFLVLFGISALAHSGLATKYRKWWILVTFVLCSVAETLGWGARIWSAYEPRALIPFQIQLCCTILAPTFTLAGVFTVFGQIIRTLGPQYARLTPVMYSVIFISADVVSLIVQAVGGGIASNVAQAGAPERGGHIMLGGIIFQFVVLLLSVAMAMEYFIRYYKRLPLREVSPSIEKNIDSSESNELNLKVRTMMAAMGGVAFCLFIRGIYRTIELADGWTGVIIQTQVYFNVFDGAMIVLAQYILIAFHPGRLLVE
ncbi:RTA1-like protein [Flagelloscypha sp. PMI_526]|nr:RTA1-like protein [Flagelloscypha sp. PMI_526]